MGVAWLGGGAVRWMCIIHPWGWGWGWGRGRGSAGFFVGMQRMGLGLGLGQLGRDKRSAFQL